MDMTLEIYTKMERGDALSDAELVCAYNHFNQLEVGLRVLGPKFHFAFVECSRRAQELQGYITNRQKPR